MSSSNRQASLSPGEQQRAKSRSSSRSHRTPSNTGTHDEDKQREKTASQASKRNTREIKSTKRSDTSPSSRSTNPPSSKSNTSKKQRSNVKTPTSSSSKSKSPSSKSKSPSPNRKGGSKRKKTSISTSDTENKQTSQANDSERQDLSSRGLSTVPAEILELVSLRCLILSNNNLSGLPTGIRSLINLEYLDISRNPLRVKNGLDDYFCLPREFRYLRNLHTLIMAECTLKHIPAAVWNTISLQTLDLSRNKISYIVGEIGNLINLRHLRLSQMDLDTLPPEIGFCEKLKTIDLTSNPIDNLPETLVECRQLYEFKINYQTFYKLLDNYMIQLIDEGKIHSEHIPQVIFELEGLQVLDLNTTKLNSIPNQHTLFNLNELYLSNNSFFDIPESLCTMEQLRILDMSNNRLQTIPEYCIKIERLKTLILSQNNLTTLPSHIAHLSTLKNLIVNHNQINTIENGFSQNRSLLTLDLSYNNLEIIPNELCNLEQLETLDLRYNQIENLPLSIRHMKGLKSMNIIDENFQRIGLHLLGNPIKDPPSYIWKSAFIKTLFDYIETKEKSLLNHFYHLKLILIGPKNVGKTALIIKILNNHKVISNNQKILDMYVSSFQENQLKLNEQEVQKQKRLSDATSSILTDQWIENRISTTNDNDLNHTLKIKRTNPPPLKTYRSNELFENFMYKSTIITKNNFYCTIFDVTYEPNFEILYPLIYDSNALFILPVNLTILSNIVQAATSLENMNDNENHISIIDYDSLLTHDWLYSHIFRYIESISDHCQQASIAIVGLIMNNQVRSNDHQQQLLDEIHSKINMFLTDEENQRKNINLYSEFFSEPIYLDKEETSDRFIEILEIIAEQWNIIHHKGKRQVLKRRLGFIKSDSLIIDYDTCLIRFQQQQQQQNQSLSVLFDNEKNESIEQEINQMTFDECLDYLKITGDILCFEQNSPKTILVKPYYLLNNILCRTIFRPHINEWLNYDDNMVFHFSGYYQTQDLFNIDRQRLLTRGEYTWNMLNVLFYELNDNNIKLIERNIIDFCHLMEHLYLGYLNESNSNYREFTAPYFVCPWLMNEKTLDMNYKDYFKLLEQKRSYENLQCEQKRRLKQYQIWLAMDHEQENMLNKNFLEEKDMNYSQEHFQITIEDLPSFDQIEINDSQIINQDLINILKIINGNSYFLPNGLYERLLICLHPLFYERLDYYNLTLGRTKDKSLIKTERCDNQNQIHITISQCLLERIQNILIHNLFSFYPTINLRIET
ncbi:unnamed protein product [Rotaria sp. Silwood1]|nr:unnamed protein product [Rotaria sp. Silwood1]CAF0997802.1 unnamed protein product [Rotaria sp. Silwood1]CAF3407281.1 unnamed protein product [Rotaria sp. Silwood1]CAF4773621.1 unnamed protein product [Rotaria sp. Silwood1]